MTGVPRWLRVAGVVGWLALGVLAAAGVGLWLLSYLSFVVTPLLLAGVLAIIFWPVVDWLAARHVPRIVAALLVLLVLLGVVALCVWAVLKGVVDSGPEIVADLQSAQASIQSGLKDLGLSDKTAADTASAGADAIKSTFQALLGGLFTGIRGISAALFMGFIGSVMFLLMLLNGRRYADWLTHHTGMPARVMSPLLEDSANAIRGYAWGTTIVATANAIPIGLSAWLLGLPLVGTITLITFVTAYIPYFGAIVASVFVCLIALGAEGLPVALAMLVIILLVNNVLQNVLAPVAYGATLKLDALVVLLVTTAAGLVGGIMLIVLAAPLTAILVRAATRIAEAGRAPMSAIPVWV